MNPQDWIKPPPLKNRKPWQKLWRLPRHLEPVLGVIVSDEIKDRAIGVVGFDEGTQKWTIECWEDLPNHISITHWMPLPKLPKDERL